MVAKIKIDPEFSALIPAVADSEAAELERTILQDGRIFEPLVLWKHNNILLDGHRRNAILRKHPTLKAPPPIVLDLESRQEAHDWIIHHQLAKRNVNEQQRRYLLGKLYRNNQKSVGRPNGNTANVAELSSAAEIAEKEGVSERSIHNAAAFTDAVDTVAEAVGPEIKDAILAGEVKATTKDLERLADIPTEQAHAVAEQITSGEAKSVGQAMEQAGVSRKPPKPRSKAKGRGAPTVDARKFVEFEKHLGKAVRLNSALKEHCGGAEFHGQIRNHINESMKALAAWRKSTGAA